MKSARPKKMMPVARILVVVVPSLLASRPPTRGVQVLLREKAEMRSENSVLFVPISRDSRDLRGPRMYDALGMAGKETCVWSNGIGSALTNGCRCSMNMHIAVRELG